MFTDIGEVVPQIGLNTLLGYILVMCGGSLGQVWLIKGFFDSIPMSLDEAAMIDGASHVQVFFRIILPLVTTDPRRLRPAGLRRHDRRVPAGLDLPAPTTARRPWPPASTACIDGDRSNNLGVFAAGGVMTAIPVVLLFLYLQRFIVGGITAGGVKG